MWQVVLAAAAAAGSGILAKKLIHPNNESQNPLSREESEIQSSQDMISPSPMYEDDANGEENTTTEEAENGDGKGKIFRFSSPQSGNKDVKKKKTWGGFKANCAKKGKKCVGDSKQKHPWVDQRTGKKVTVCLKKRRTSASGKCESCASKDNSFGWGVGLGIMCMMSAGKAEISRLNSAMEETGKVVQELKAEISRSKSICNSDTSVTEYETVTNEHNIERSCSALIFTKQDTGIKSKIPTFGRSMDEGQCGSSGLTEDQQPEALEMDRLEAELESELLKLPWCDDTECSDFEGGANISEADDTLVRRRESDGFLGSNSHQYKSIGVLPTELDNKLCHVLIEQQGSQIAELEAELHRANSKLHEKEAELQALKNCVVKRLSEFSLANASDEENEKMEDVRTEDTIESATGFEA